MTGYFSRNAGGIAGRIVNDMIDVTPRIGKMKPAPLSVDVCLTEDGKELYPSPIRPATDDSAGIDLISTLDATLEPGERIAIPVGMSISLNSPNMTTYAGFIYSRSGLGAKSGIVVAQGVGVIDPDYRGEITVVLLNTSKSAYKISRGDRIAQLVVQPIQQIYPVVVDQLDSTARGDGGFGSTGV